MTTTSSSSDIALNRLKMIEEMLDTHPDDPFLHFASALEHRKAGNKEKATQILEALIFNIPEYLGSYYQLGKLYEESGNTDKAIAVYKQGETVARKQNDVKTLGELSEALMILEDD